MADFNVATKPFPKPKQQSGQLTHEFAELINVLLLRGPAGGKSNNRMRFIVFFPKAERNLLFKTSQLLIFNNKENLIGW